ncbi:hypothetical protein Purlil1_14295 [Purpureocillium lilacinum]|uniref:Reverse transcriptase Ty1/copia-type domain-containing protein n=1 Tax=Purpureocillium lilacinum TaxID=33203 RepID=A0ABR0BBN2_PURLI|nr:hypothetical protein Purlil1_14295 [Purpureocillium lilacinum]
MNMMNLTALTHLPRGIERYLIHHDQQTADRRLTMQAMPVKVQLLKPLITRRRPSSDGHSMHPDTQPSSDLQPQAARGATRTRRSQRELYGDQPTRKSSRTPKPRRKHGDDVHSVFTALLPIHQHPEGSLKTFHSIFLAAVSKAARDHRFHRDDLVRLPKRGLSKEKPVYVQLPKGYVDLGFLKPGETPTMVAELEKALYGLRESPLLWYNEVSQALKEAGIDRTDEEPCVFTNGKILVLVYVNDAYIEKIARKFQLEDSKLRPPTIPITTVPLKRYDGQASKDEVKAYQERVGSLTYAAVMTRPDIARAAAQLARFLTNPSPGHLAAANQCIQYLYTTRYLAIVYDGLHGGEALVIASDASFADDVESRRSSQGYVMMLFNGPVAWKAGLQDTVTTSTTEAEILSLEKTAKESYALDRLLRDISLDLGPLRIYCDNLQTCG